jgi:alkanesulfonate monooxygenase SsuD/methylene tetrahydromethanopterin reductase-like flavin-dependent oxidoreductase (luciferase family)
MDFGVAFPARVGDHGLVALAEQLGYRQAWFYDSQMIYSDVYATMALAADRTSRIRLATGVAIPSTRMAPVIAHSIATIHELAPGRVELGLGSGNTARLTMGLRPLPLRRLREDMRLIRTLLDGESGTLRQDGEENQVRFLHPDRGFIRLRPRIPITLSALGPKALELCGAEADAHLTWGATPAQLEQSRAVLALGAARTRRTLEAIPSKGIYPTALLEPGETSTSPRVLCTLAPFMTNYLHVQVEWGDRLLPPSPAVQETVERYRRYAADLPAATRHLTLHEGHLLYARDDEREFLTPELADTVALVGDPDAVIERIRALERAGLSHFVFQVTDEAEKQLREFAHRVMDRY